MQYGLTKTRIRQIVNGVRTTIDEEGNTYRDYRISRRFALRMSGYNV